MDTPRDFPITPLEVKKGIVGRALKFAGYIHHYKSLPIFNMSFHLCQNARFRI